MIGFKQYLSELSKDTLNSYVKKASDRRKSYEKKEKKHDKKEDLYRDAKAGENIYNRKSDKWWKYDRKIKKHEDKKREATKNISKKDKGITTAKAKLGKADFSYQNDSIKVKAKN